MNRVKHARNNHHTTTVNIITVFETIRTESLRQRIFISNDPFLWKFLGQTSVTIREGFPTFRGLFLPPSSRRPEDGDRISHPKHWEKLHILSRLSVRENSTDILPFLVFPQFVRGYNKRWSTSHDPFTTSTLQAVQPVRCSIHHESFPPLRIQCCQRWQTRSGR